VLIFALAALVPVTYLFINRNLLPRERRRPPWLTVLVAAAWGLAYAVLLGLVLGNLGVIAGLAIGIVVLARR
jgi:hypothetical protein